MRADSVYFKGHLCFREEWAGFDTIKPINVIIGRNNSGKSHLLDLVEALCQGKLGGRGWQYRCSGVLDEESLRRAFSDSRNGGDLVGNHWHGHGVHFVNAKVTWEIDPSGNIAKDPEVPELDRHPRPQSIRYPDPNQGPPRLSRIKNLISELGGVGAIIGLTHQLSGKVFRKLAADRDIKTEPPENQLPLGFDGSGATNIIRRFINSSNEQFPREVIQHELRDALNTIFGSDGQFTEIQVQEHDDQNADGPQGHWEVYLGEDRKGLISLTNSGSGLKTVFLVLLNLLVVPRIEERGKSQFTFGFEELENNLHPALLRRLLQYLEKYALDEQATIFLTTHSSTALDLFGASENAQTIHVTHDGETARTTTVSAHFDRLGVVSELGAKPSDLLQANGIVWVEGPSDRVYLNHWIQLYSEGALREGRDYQCAFYGGALLARIEFQPPEEETELANLLRVNPNIVVVCDGDRDSEKSRIKGRVKRIRAEVKNIPAGHIWITEAREIENYIPGSVLGQALGVRSLPNPEQYESFFPRKAVSGQSYLEARVRGKHVDKMDLAMQSILHMTKDSMAGRFDWEDQIEKIVGRIRSWNV